MDVNGTRFHLLKGKADWLQYQEEVSSPSMLPHLEWDEQGQSLTLTSLLPLFPARNDRDLLDPSSRRGAAIDRFGNRYWIANDGTGRPASGIFWHPSGADRPSRYWMPADGGAPSRGAFRPLSPSAPRVIELAGMAVTKHHYLVVGNVTQRGLFRFDLAAGGEPLLLLFPEGVPFEPFAITPSPDGGVWVLDRAHRAYWGLDSQFRIVTDPTAPPQGGSAFPGPSRPFHPVGAPAPAPSPHPVPAAFSVDAIDPISIAPLPDGTVLILDTPRGNPGAGPSTSTVHHYRLGRRASPPIPLAADVEVAATGTETTLTHLAVHGYDMVYLPADGTLYVVEGDGKQVIAFGLNLDPSQSPWSPLTVRRTYLPLHFFGRRALVVHEQAVFYDVAAGDPGKDSLVRWVQLQGIDQPRYHPAAAFVLPAFDGKERDCTWDRLCLDACIPAETAVRVYTRAANDANLLQSQAFLPEPDLYLRGSGAEVPYYDPYADLVLGPGSAGTWELLFQEARGRFLQIRVEVSGNGRDTPRLRALRAYYPRFSYPRHYLPAVYLEDAESAGFLERFLSNPEGFFTEIEGKIGNVGVLLDARTAPPDTLDWLASWVGLILDPLWGDIQKRRAAGVPGAAPPDRRRLFIRFAMRLYARRGTPDGVRLALELLLDPCLESTLQRFKNASIIPDQALADELRRLNLPLPTAAMTEEQFEDLLLRYLLAPARPSKVRLVERFLTRGGRALVAGDPTQPDNMPLSGDTIAGAAHRFSVLVPENLPTEEAAMVDRIVSLEKPAHTLHDVRRFWDYFRVGEARLAIDTVLGEDSRFTPIILGRDYLDEGYLSAAFPMDVPDRLISDRDRLGTGPL